MNINATLFAEMFAFFLFVVFTMKVIWPMLAKPLAEREKTIADGLAAGRARQAGAG